MSRHASQADDRLIALALCALGQCGGLIGLTMSRRDHQPVADAEALEVRQAPLEVNLIFLAAEQHEYLCH
jgi:hypothetical protein